MSDNSGPIVNHQTQPVGKPAVDAADLSARRAALTAAQREQLAARLRGSQRRRLLERADRSQPVPLSFLQEQIWLHQELNPESIAYNRPLLVRILGALDVAALARSLTEILRRHETLRTVIRLEKDRPFQAILPEWQVTLPVTDVSSETNPVAAADRVLEEDVRRPFPIQQDVLWRTRLLRCAASEHFLAIVFHHLIFDRWSETVFMTELATAYRACTRGSAPAWQELPVQYADYAAWQRTQEPTAAFQQGVQYWRETLRDLPRLQLPTDRPRKDIPSETADSIPIHLSPELVNGLKQVGRRDEVTLFVILLAAWNTLLYRYSGQTDLVVGCPVAGRMRQEFEGLIGLFINTLPLRLRLSGDSTFRQLMMNCRQTYLDAMRHQDVSLQQIVRHAIASQGKGGSTGFDVMMVYENFPDLRQDDAGTRFETATVALDVAIADLVLELNESPHGVFGKLVYRGELWDRSSLERMVNHFQTLLAGIAANPESQIDRLPLMTDAEQRQILQEWNDSATEDPLDICVHELFEEQVQRTPDAVAMVYGDDRLTYQELNCRANRVAQGLIQAGAGPDTLVGLCMERSTELIVALLGILKSGGAYLPIEPSVPAERLSLIVEDSGLKWLLTRSADARTFPDVAVPVLTLDEVANAPVNAAPSNPASHADPHHLAYVIYTSGSTGRPKGVMIEHRGLINYLKWCLKTYPAHGTWGAPVHSSYAFDLSVTSLFVPLLAGGSLVLVDENRGMDGLMDVLFSHPDFCFFKGTPAHLSLLNEVLEENQFAARARALVIGGEQLLAEQVAPWREHAPHTRVFNEYGPTETTVGSCVYLVDQNSPTSGPLPIGRPIANTQVYVLDDRRQPVPVGVPGELYIGGAGVARGYLNRPELTAEKFIANPFCRDSNARLYRTGDQVRWRSDGNLEFLGRLDQQIKLRGYRIELGEIESALAKHPRVAGAAVMLREDRPGDKRLAAYVVPKHPEHPPSATELRDDLLRSLPEYLVPTVFVSLAELPLTSNGKLNRHALPVPAADRSEQNPLDVIAPSPLEALLMGIWSEVLGRECLSRDDNFFELGGHSLAAMRVAARCRRLLGREIPVKMLFVHPTIAKLASFLALEELPAVFPDNPAAHKDDISTETPSPEKLPSHQPALFRSGTTPLNTAIEPERSFPLSYSQQQLFFLDQLGESPTAYNIAEMWQLNGRLDVESFRLALEAIIARHEALRTRFGLRDGEPFQYVEPPRTLELPIHDFRALPEPTRAAEVTRRSIAEAETPFQLATDGQLLRAQLLRTADRQHLFLLTLHHIAADGFSLQVLWQELKQLYESYLREEAPSLAPLPCRISDYVAWQQAESRHPRFQDAVEYWRRQLAGLMPLELTSDRPRPNWSTHRGAWLPLHWGADLVRELRELSRDAGTTLHIVLLAAFQVLLYRYSQQADFGVGVPIHGRLKPEFEPLIGMFVNTLVLRVHLSAEMTFRNVLSQVHETSFAAYDHEQVPFEKLVEELQPERHTGHNPLVQVLFQLLETSIPKQLAEIDLVRQTSPSQRSHVDLEVLLRSDGEEISGEMIGCTDLFDVATIERMATHFQYLLEAIVHQPETSIAQLPLLPEAERQQLLVEWNATRRHMPELCVHQLFERQAALRPESVALVAGGQSWTYALLNRQSNQLARRLQALGVGPESRVGISLERSPLMIVGVLAVLKAGGAYVPLDRNYPTERLSLLLRDSGVTLVLTQRDWTESWRDFSTPLLCLDDPLEQWLTESDANLAVDVSLDNLAYVMYTSGSTGTPKGVEILHRGIVRLVCGADYVDLDETQSVLQFATLSFDASTFEIWAPLLNGGRCVQAPPELLDPAELARLLREEHVRTLWLTSTMFNTLIDVMPDALTGIEQLLVGGEALSVPHIRRAQQVLGPRTQLINGYGPTESTTFACCYRLPHDIPADWMSIPIGRPIANTTAYVLDHLRQPVPIGVPGELYIGGEGLARGYLNRPELTAQRFVKNPFSADPHSRLYRTGDRVRWRADGLLEFLGRFDEQLKIRGYRIEPGEIEAVLRQHPALRDVVVMATADPKTGGKQLTAYLVPLDRPAHASVDWRGWLASRIPAYMIPAYYVELERFPRTSGGKIDRRLLPAPIKTATQSPEASTAPRSALEVRITEVWCEALQRPRIDRDANFFDLGGHSLLALRIAAKLSAALDQPVPVALFFQCPTVAAMTDALANMQGRSSVGVINELRAGSSEPPLFFFPPIGAELFSTRDLVRALPTTRAVYGLDWHAGSDRVEFNTLDEIARHCAAHIQAFRPTGPYLLAGYSFGARLAFETACRLIDAGAQVGLVAVIDAGPGTPADFSWTERLLSLVRCLENLPRWIYSDFLADSAHTLAGRLQRKTRQVVRGLFHRWSAEGEPELKAQIEDLFDDGVFPAWFQQRQHADLLAAVRHQPAPYPIKVTLFLARVRPLLHGHLVDLAWKRVARQGVEIHSIPGHHGTMMRPPHVQELAIKLGAALVEAGT